MAGCEWKHGSDLLATSLLSVERFQTYLTGTLPAQFARILSLHYLVNYECHKLACFECAEP